MNVYFLKNLPASQEMKRSKNSWFAGILLAGLLLGCGNDASDTFVRFQVEGQSYEVKNPSLFVTRMPFNMHFLDLTYPPKPLVPGATIQWRMKLESLEQLVGQNLTLKNVDPNKVGPVAIFRITPDLSVQGTENSIIHLKIDRIVEGFIEGSFSGKDLAFISRAKEERPKVDVTARFRAKLIQKK
jgi:hypothetical protein